MGRESLRKTVDRHSHGPAIRKWLNSHANPTIVLVLLALETVLCFLILWRVPYTEIDWSTYMQQVQTFLQGERNYAAIEGDTGPIVYPAGHLYSYTLLYWLTGHGQVSLAQPIFAVLYLATQAVVMALYVRSKAVPAWALLLLCLSRRLHSIFILRLFNDCLAVLVGYAAIWLLLSRRWRTALLTFSIAVSVKMNILLLAPAVLIVLMKGTDLRTVVEGVGLGILWQLLLGAPFLYHNAGSYISRSFDFSRVFQHKWSVNLKFLPEETFQSRAVAIALLVAHVGLLWLFAQKKWCRDIGGLPNLAKFFVRKSQTSRTGKGSATYPNTKGRSGGRELERRYEPFPSDKALLILFTSTFIGVLCARSLHYQFYSWYFHMIPYLLWQAQMHSIVRCGLWLIVELTWNIYPSTPTSSGWLMVSHLCILTALWSYPSID